MGWPSLAGIHTESGRKRHGSGQGRTMNKKTTSVTVGAAALGFLSSFIVGLFLFGAGQSAEAQNNNANARRTTAATVTHAARYLNKIELSDSEDKILEQHAFPESPVFLVRTKEAVQVWERRENSLNSLLTIPVENEFKELMFLGDHRSFTIRTDSAIGVYSIDKRLPDGTSVANTR